ncbi:arylsulfatase [Sediminicola luteus]|uniref:Arylsulfatase n=2 Tax=Sediminicola luteus TaxID=319238 RepID=A0A2A4G9E2_9FLAO|nr:arylsulfatase [Sediminicola luteus]
MGMRSYLFLLLSLLGLSVSVTAQQIHQKPNIVIIYMDDLGFGDVSAYGQGKLQTPNIDRIAQNGILFENGYATSATCTPSRYSLLTGLYPWRNQKAQVLSGDAPLLIDPEPINLPKLLKQAGYRTGVVGKWHLGLGNGQVDWNSNIGPGPNEIGFDDAYIMAATNDRVPNVYVDNGKVEGLNANDPLYTSYKTNFEGEPTGKENPELLKVKYSHGHDGSINNGVSRIGFQKGGKSAQWVDEDMSDLFLEKSIAFIKKVQDRPFFLYYALHQPHVPRVPHKRFVGQSGMGPRGDAILEADWCIGQFLDYLEEAGLHKNTLIIFSSDNGPVLDDGYFDQAAEQLGDHTPWGPYRGGKYSLFEAGTHVPFLVSWPGTVEPGVSEALVSQVDLLASLATLVKVQNPETDSIDILEALMGRSEQGRESLIIEAVGHRTAMRKGDYVLIPPHNGPKKITWGVDMETGFSKALQLYHLPSDPGQQNNLAPSQAAKAQELWAEYKRLIDED